MERAIVITDAGEIAKLIRALGQAWRGDWSDFDGRTLRKQLDELAEIVLEAQTGLINTPEKVAKFYVDWGFCPQCESWIEYCDCEKSS